MKKLIALIILANIITIGCSSSEKTKKELLKSAKSCGASPHGTIRSGYLQMTTPEGVPCTMGSQECFDGEWVENEIFQDCTEVP